MVERNREWEQKEGIEKAYNVGRSVYYIAKSTDERHNNFYVQYWPNRNKSIETISLLEGFDKREKAADFLEKKVNEYR